jgi:hypothetical protein
MMYDSQPGIQEGVITISSGPSTRPVDQMNNTAHPPAPSKAQHVTRTRQRRPDATGAVTTRSALGTGLGDGSIEQ